MCSIIFQYHQTALLSLGKKITFNDYGEQFFEKKDYTTLHQIIINQQQQNKQNYSDQNNNNSRFIKQLDNSSNIIRPDIYKDAYKYNVPWPQMDDRIQRAILKHGILINVDQTPQFNPAGDNDRRRRRRFSPSTWNSPFGYYPCNMTTTTTSSTTTSSMTTMPVTATKRARFAKRAKVVKKPKTGKSQQKPNKEMNITTTLQPGYCESPPPNLATIVTAYYNIKSKRPKDYYMTWFPNLLAATDPMVIFVEPGVDKDGVNWVEFVSQRRQHAPTIIVPFPFHDLTMATTFTDTFWKKVFEKDFQPHLHRDMFVYKIWNEKIIFVHNVVHLNPFNSHEIFWMDAGYFRKYSKDYTTIIRNNITNNGIPNNKVLMLDVLHYEYFPRVAGNAWGGTPTALNHFYLKYFETFWYLANNHQLNNTQSCIGVDQQVIVYMCRNFGDSICALHHNTDEWFVMGEVWLGYQIYKFGVDYGSRRIKYDFETTAVVKQIQYPDSSIKVIDQNFMDSHVPIYLDD